MSIARGRTEPASGRWASHGSDRARSTAVEPQVAAKASSLRPARATAGTPTFALRAPPRSRRPAVPERGTTSRQPAQHAPDEGRVDPGADHEGAVHAAVRARKGGPCLRP